MLIPRENTKLPLDNMVAKCEIPLKAAVNSSQEFSPADYIRCIVPADFEPINETPLSVNKTQVTEGYTMEAVQSIRNNDVVALRHMLKNGHCFDSCNANGEYLIHLACRRSQPETVKFLLNEARVQTDVRDTMGRTILHDVCWKSSPDLEMMSTVLHLVPLQLFLAKDMRGNTPFDFARKHHWKHWIDFLSENQGVFQERLYDQ